MLTIHVWAPTFAWFMRYYRQREYNPRTMPQHGRVFAFFEMKKNHRTRRWERRLVHGTPLHARGRWIFKASTHFISHDNMFAGNVAAQLDNLRFRDTYTARYIDDIKAWHMQPESPLVRYQYEGAIKGVTPQIVTHTNDDPEYQRASECPHM